MNLLKRQCLMLSIKLVSKKQGDIGNILYFLGFSEQRQHYITHGQR